MASFLLEVRTEEIPANALPGARSQLEREFRSRLESAGFEPTAVSVSSTSRRLVVLVEDLPEIAEMDFNPVKALPGKKRLEREAAEAEAAKEAEEKPAEASAAPAAAEEAPADAGEATA